MSDLRARLEETLGAGYRIEHELGGGGMSRVFLAEETALARRVVVKVLPPDLAGDVSVQRFRREVQLAARLQHPHIVALHSAGEVDGLPYYTMPFIEGESLRTRLSRGGELPISETVRIMRDVAAALAHAHASGVVHRDIKPENVLLSGGEAMVTDFGVAKAVSAAAEGTGTLTSVGLALGTPVYMSPEQASADPATDHRADIYALGVMAYEMLTGHPPFTGRAPQAIIAAHAIEAPQSVTERRPSVPAPLADLVMQCLAKRAADRPQTAVEVVHRLESLVLSGESRAARAAAAPTSGARRPLIAAGIAAVAVVLGAGGYVFTRSPAASVEGVGSVIAVLPLSPTSPDTSLERLGRDLAVTLSANLDGVDELRTLDAVAVLANLGDGAGAQDASAIARRLGATSVVQGTLLRVGDLVRADVSLVRLDAGASMHTERASALAAPHEVAALTDSLTWALLRQIWRRGNPPTPSITAITTRSLGALRHFLEGERLVAEHNFLLAGPAYANAIAADSSFWLAYARYRWANLWIDEPVPGVINDRLFANLESLPERERRQLEISREPSLSRRLALRHDLARRFPDYWPIVLDYGDLLMHHAPLIGHEYHESLPYLERVTQLNPRFMPAWDHLIAAQIERPDRIRAVLDTLVAIGRTEPLAQEFGFDLRELFYSILAFQGDTVEIRRRSPERLGDLLAQYVGPPSLGWVPARYFGVLTGPVSQAAISSYALRGNLASDVAAAHREAVLASTAARGAWREAAEQAVQLTSRHPTREQTLFAFNVMAVGEWLGAPVASAAARTRATVPEATLDAEQRAQLAWLDGIRAIASNEPSDAARAEERIRASGSFEADDLAAGLRLLHQLAVERSGSAARELMALEMRRADRLNPPFGGAVAVHRLAAARVLREEGNAVDASRLLNWLIAFYTDRGVATAALLTQPLNRLERARARRDLGDLDAARRDYEWFLDQFDRPEMEQQHLVAEARAELAQLSDAGAAAAVR